MPEGPEAHHCSKVLNDKVAGLFLTRIELSDVHPFQIKDEDNILLKLPFKLDKVYAVGKKVVFHFQDDRILVVCLGMSGKFLFEEAKHTRATFIFTHSAATGDLDSTPPLTRSQLVSSSSVCPRAENNLNIKNDDSSIDGADVKLDKVISTSDEKDVSLDEVQLYYDNTRAFHNEGILFSCLRDFTAWRSTFLGWDPLQDAPLSNDEWSSFFCKKRGKIASVLAEQHNVCGIGNYLRCEILRAAEIDPRRRACDLDKDELQTLLTKGIMIMKKSLNMGGHTIESYCDPTGKKGKYEPVVYSRPFTNDAYKHPVKTVKIGTQTVWYDPLVQR